MTNKRVLIRLFADKQKLAEAFGTYTVFNADWWLKRAKRWRKAIDKGDHYVWAQDYGFKTQKDHKIPKEVVSEVKDDPNPTY